MTRGLMAAAARASPVGAAVINQAVHTFAHFRSTGRLTNAEDVPDLTRAHAAAVALADLWPQRKPLVLTHCGCRYRVLRHRNGNTELFTWAGLSLTVFLLPPSSQRVWPMSKTTSASAGAPKPALVRQARPFTKTELQLFQRALENVDATANALATLCASELPLRAVARGDLAVAASQSCSVARAALRRLSGSVNGPQSAAAPSAGPSTTSTGEAS